MSEIKNHFVFSSFYNIKGQPADGYSNFITPYFNRLAQDATVFGYGMTYNKTEHGWNFGVNHCRPDQIIHIISTLANNLPLTSVTIALDLTPHVFDIFQQVKLPRTTKRIAISAIEADPLTKTVITKLASTVDTHINISEFGNQLVSDAGIDSIHLPAIVNPAFTRKTDAEQKEIKAMMDLSDKFVIFVNADGNERKNTAVVFEALGLVKQKNPNFHLVLLTRKNSPVSWDYDDLMFRFKLLNHVSILDRTLGLQEVANLYKCADLTLVASKAGGLELPILESQACGTLVMSGDYCGMSENVKDGKGIPLQPSFTLIDVFMNGNRRFISKETLAEKILEVMENKSQNPNCYDDLIEKGYQAVQTRTIENHYELFSKAIGQS